mmetsp:Transcript_15164/g.23409  ORF Transcript_15164/g.23409 Transcript_15164/m.23409 type:complete len:82 (+) Transcript_15164:1736-1981(+)
MASRTLSEETRSICTEILSSEEEQPRGTKTEHLLSEREVELFNLLKQAYQSTIKQLFSLCMHSCKPQGNPMEQMVKKKVKI